MVFSRIILLIASGVALRAESRYADIPLYFEENRGQSDERVKYLSRAPGYTSFVTPDGLTVSLAGEGGANAALSLRLAGANGEAEIVGEDELSGTSSYFLGADASRWVSGAKQFRAVRVKEIRPGVDLIYHGYHRDMEFDLVVKPHARPDAIRLRFEGAEKLSIGPNGDLVIATAAGEVRQHKPSIWQEMGGKKTPVSGRYRLTNRGEVAIALGRYDHSRALTIDPVLSYSTYLGGSTNDGIVGIAVDSLGNAYLTGGTTSVDFPTTVGAYRVALNGTQQNLFVAKLKPSGTALVYSTYLGGSAGNTPAGIAIDGNGNAYITGSTVSSDFPTVSPFQSSLQGAGDAFVAKINPTGTALVYSTYLGGQRVDSATAISVDATGAAFVAGTTYSVDFPTISGAYATAKPSTISYGSGFIAKLAPAGSALVYATYLGGNANEQISAIAVDSTGIAYVTGETPSTNFPVTAGAIQSSLKGNNGGNAFVSALNAAGSGLVYSTYLGGSYYDMGLAIAVDSSQSVYVAGKTGSTDFPVTAGAFQTAVTGSYYANHGFIAKLNSTGTSLTYATYLGGSANDTIYGIALDGASHALVTGTTNSPDFPLTPGSFPRVNNLGYYSSNGAAFLAELNGSGSSVLYSTYLGASGYVVGSAIGYDGAGNAFVTGTTTTKTLPTTPGALQSTNRTSASHDTGFAMKVNLNDPTSCTLSLGSNSFAAPLGGASSTFGVSVQSGCPWEAANTNNWITVSAPAEGIGNGTVSFTVAPNYSNSNAQSGVIQVGASNFNITQPAGSCSTPGLSPVSSSFDSLGGLENISLQIPYGCGYSVTANVPWITVTTPSYGNGSGTVTFFVAHNDFAARSGSITIAGANFPVTQSGGSCTDSLSATSASLPAQGGTGVVPFTTSSPSCQWNAVSLAPWIQIVSSTASGAGSGNIGFVAAPNIAAAARNGQIYVGGLLFTISEAGGIMGTPAAYTISTIAGTGPNYSGGSYGGDGGPASAAVFYYPSSVAFDSAGNLFVSDSENYRIRKIGLDGTINTVAGTGTHGFSGDNGAATSAQIGVIEFIATDASGNLFMTDTDNRRVRKWTTNGTISTIAGSGVFGTGGDGGSATAATFNNLTGITVDSSGNVFVADSYGDRVREVTPANGNINAFAGIGNYGFAGDNGPAFAAWLAYPSGLALDSAGNLFIADGGNGRIRRVHSGTITTFAGGGTSSADGIQATSASMSPNSLAFDGAGNLLMGDSNAGLVRRIDTSGVISTIAGGGPCCNLNDGGPAKSAYISVTGLASDSKGNIAIADSNNGRIRLLSPAYSFCSYSLTSSSLNAPGAAGSQSLNLTTGSNCAWNAVSAAPWITISSSASGTGNATVMLAVAANSATPRTGTVNIGGQNVSITQAGLLKLTSSSGSGQSAAVSTAFAQALAALVTDGLGTPQSGVSVTFTAPASGASGTFAGNATVTTNAQGIATAPVFTANAIAGSYSVTATAGTFSTTFSLANLAAQTISFGALTNVSYGAGPFTISATASSGLAVTFASNTTAVCTVSGNTVTIVSAGGCSITAMQAGNATYAAAAPVTQTFAVGFLDVQPTDYYFNAINLLAQRGITTGCGSNNFCPAQVVTRYQMAVFIVRAIEGGDNFTTSSTPYFGDVPVNAPGFKWIQKMFELGITTGCGNGNYCPNDGVTRDQMAVFIIRARYGANAAFTYPATPTFSDVPSSETYFKWIQRLAQDGITAGCGSAQYCPGSPVIRGDMAIFLMRGAFNQLLPANTPVVAQISPATLSPGGSATFTVTGSNTHFVPGTTTLSPIPGVTIGTITVASATSLTVQLTAAANAVTQPYSIVAITGGEQAVLPNGFAIQ